MHIAAACVPGGPTYNREPCISSAKLEIHAVENNLFCGLIRNLTLLKSASMLAWFRNVWMAVSTILRGLFVTLRTMGKTYNRKAFAQIYEYPEVPLKVKPRYRGFHRFDLTTCIGCEKCAQACPVDCIYIEKEKSPVGKGFRLNGFAIDYTKCMFCALCTYPCPTDCIHMGNLHDLSGYDRESMIVEFTELAKEGLQTPQPMWLKGDQLPEWAEKTRTDWVDRGKPLRDEMLKALEPSEVKKK